MSNTAASTNDVSLSVIELKDMKKSDKKKVNKSDDADVLPPYEVVINSQHELGQPPAYDDLHSKIKRSCCIINKDKLFKVITVIIYIILSITSLGVTLVGITYIDDCTVDSKIPVWLIGNGLISLLIYLWLIFLTCFSVSKSVKNLKSNYARIIKFCFYMPLVLFCFAFIFWLVEGTLWILGSMSQINSSNCNVTCFQFARSFVIAGWFSVISCSCLLFTYTVRNKCIRK